jgi:hypothetical protein
MEVASMEMMFLGPALLVCGMLLIYLASASTRARPVAPRRAWEGRAAPASPAGGDAAPAEPISTLAQDGRAVPWRRRGKSRLDEADLLLAEALSELLAVRSEVADLRSRVDAIGGAPGRKRRGATAGRAP